MKNKIAVIAIGGNSLIKDKQHQTVLDQYLAVKETCKQIVSMIKTGWNVVMTHGNGPQVGFILQRSELASHELHEIPLDVCGADSQGAIGYALQQNLQNKFKEFGLNNQAVTLITQVEVSADDPAFKKPNKPIGSFMGESDAICRQEQEGWDIVEDAGRGWRRVVPSPFPVRIVEENVVKKLIAAGITVITAGGGGIPVVADEGGKLKGLAAVIDKDSTSALLACNIGADLFIISTSVEKVALNFGKPDEKWIDHLTLADAREYLSEGIHFAEGSMAPKIQAVINFLEKGGKEAIITNPENIEQAVIGKTGTHITMS